MNKMTDKMTDKNIICSECSGSGKQLANLLSDEIDYEPCWLCCGEGKVSENQRLEFD